VTVSHGEIVRIDDDRHVGTFTALHPEIVAIVEKEPCDQLQSVCALLCGCAGVRGSTGTTTIPSLLSSGLSDKSNATRSLSTVTAASRVSVWPIRIAASIAVRSNNTASRTIGCRAYRRAFASVRDARPCEIPAVLASKTTVNARHQQSTSFDDRRPTTHRLTQFPLQRMPEREPHSLVHNTQQRHWLVGDR
jgi:hypothetical protein